MTTEPPHKPKMTTGSDTPPGLELDEHGNPIPFEKRTEAEKEKVRAAIAAAMHGQHDNLHPAEQDPPAADHPDESKGGRRG